MLTVYLICAVVGGTLLVLQLVLSLSGLGHDGDLNLDHDSFSGEHVGADHGGPGYTDHEHFDTHDSSWFFRLMSFRALVAAITFFGLGGGISVHAGLAVPLSFTAAVGMGVAAMFIVAWIMNFFMSLHEDGTAHMEYAIGQPASVYLTVPENESGTGKVTVTVQNRSMEYLAVTEGEAIPTGGQAVITDIVNDNTVRVKCAE